MASSRPGDVAHRVSPSAARRASADAPRSPAEIVQIGRNRVRQPCRTRPASRRGDRDRPRGRPRDGARWSATVLDAEPGLHVVAEAGDVEPRCATSRLISRGSSCSTSTCRGRRRCRRFRGSSPPPRDGDRRDDDGGRSGPSHAKRCAGASAYVLKAGAEAELVDGGPRRRVRAHVPRPGAGRASGRHAPGPRERDRGSPSRIRGRGRVDLRRPPYRRSRRTGRDGDGLPRHRPDASTGRWRSS